MAGRATHFRGLFAALAMLALLVQFASPAGFMAGHVGGAPAIVVCTGHGPLISPADDHGVPAKAPAKADHGLCAFAGHGPAPAPSLALIPLPVRFEAPVAIAGRPMHLAPGQGLAAPPPPSQGPPLRSI
jgi:hypothetical protein